MVLWQLWSECLIPAFGDGKARGVVWFSRRLTAELNGRARTRYAAKMRPGPRERVVRRQLLARQWPKPPLRPGNPDLQEL